MLTEWKLARRFLRFRRRGLARFTAAVAVVGIAAGVGSLIFAAALSRGVENDIYEKLLANTPHVVLFRHDGEKLDDPQGLITSISGLPNIRALTPVGEASAVLIGDMGTSYVILRSDAAAETGGPDEIVIQPGVELAARTGVYRGGEADLVVLHEGEAPRSIRVRIGSPIRTGLFERDLTLAALSPEALATLEGTGAFRPTAVEITTNDFFSSPATAASIRETVGGDYRVIDWQEANRPLFAAMSLERKAVFTVISLIIALAVLNITTTLALLVEERRLDIAVLRTCGARARMIAMIFLAQGAITALAGLVAGAALGVTAVAAANYWELISLSEEVYMVGEVRLAMAQADILFIAGSVAGLSILASLYPAWAASRVKPMENLRNQ
jgi:lipoprotein-releasing system permease protein